MHSYTHHTNRSIYLHNYATNIWMLAQSEYSDLRNLNSLNK